MATDKITTAFYKQVTSSCYTGIATHKGEAVIAWYDSTLCTAPATTAGYFSKGCIMTDIGAKNLKINTGTVASPTWTAVTTS